MVPTDAVAKVNVAELVPKHTAEVPVIALLTTAGLTVITQSSVEADEHAPFFTTALQAVVAVNAPVASVEAVPAAVVA